MLLPRYPFNVMCTSKKERKIVDKVSAQSLKQVMTNKLLIYLIDNLDIPRGIKIFPAKAVRDRRANQFSINAALILLGSSCQKTYLYN